MDNSPYVYVGSRSASNHPGGVGATININSGFDPVHQMQILDASCCLEFKPILQTAAKQARNLPLRTPVPCIHCISVKHHKKRVAG